MATFLDVGLLQAVDVIFPFILVWAIMFSLLQKTKVATPSPGINGLISAVFGFLVLISDTATDIVNFMIPWFAITIIFLLLLLLVFMVFGAKEADIFEYMKGNKIVGWVLLLIVVTIFVAAVGDAVGQDIGPFLDEEGRAVDTATGSRDVATSSFSQNITATLFHPKILGLMVIFGIAIFAVFLLSGEQ